MLDLVKVETEIASEIKSLIPRLRTCLVDLAYDGTLPSTEDAVKRAIKLILKQHSILSFYTRSCERANEATFDK